MYGAPIITRKKKCSSDEEEDNESINNKKISTRSTLDQRFAENEGERTAESHTAKMEVEQTAESPNNNQTFPKRPILDQRFVENEEVPTAESPTDKMEVVRTDESPTPKTSRDEWAIHRNSNNPSGHMENEGDESQFNSLSPSKNNIKQARRVTYSVDITASRERL